ncbi:hypothetical protein Hanom_Chr10g00942001 [Helianthus anomalus]
MSFMYRCILGYLLCFRSQFMVYGAYIHWRSLGVDFSQFRGGYIPKNFYMKVLFITPRVEKFGWGAPPPAPRKLRPYTYPMGTLFDNLEEFSVLVILETGKR